MCVLYLLPLSTCSSLIIVAQTLQFLDFLDFAPGALPGTLKFLCACGPYVLDLPSPFGRVSVSSPSVFREESALGLSLLSLEERSEQ